MSGLNVTDPPSLTVQMRTGITNNTRKAIIRTDMMIFFFMIVSYTLAMSFSNMCR